MNHDMNGDMNHNDIANPAFDAKLSRLFAEKNEPLSANEFSREFVSRLEREYRLRQIRRVLMIVAMLLLGACLAPAVVRVTLGMFSLVGRVEITSAMDSMLTVGMLLITLSLFFWSRKRI